MEVGKYCVCVHLHVLVSLKALRRKNEFPLLKLNLPDITIYFASGKYNQENRDVYLKWLSSRFGIQPWKTAGEYFRVSLGRLNE